MLLDWQSERHRRRSGELERAELIDMIVSQCTCHRDRSTTTWAGMKSGHSHDRRLHIRARFLALNRGGGSGRGGLSFPLLCHVRRLIGDVGKWHGGGGRQCAMSRGSSISGNVAHVSPSMRCHSTTSVSPRAFRLRKLEVNVSQVCCTSLHFSLHNNATTIASECTAITNHQ